MSPIWSLANPSGSYACIKEVVEQTATIATGKMTALRICSQMSAVGVQQIKVDCSKQNSDS
jgi:hypothetical protein